MGNTCPAAPAVAAIAIPLLRLALIIVGNAVVAQQICNDAESEWPPVSRTVSPTVAPPTKPSVQWFSNGSGLYYRRNPNVTGLLMESDEDYLGRFVVMLDLGIYQDFEYCDLSLKKHPCENLKNSKKGQEAKEGLYCKPEPAFSCLLLQTALPNGTLKKFFDDFFNNRIRTDWEFCANANKNFYCGEVATNFSKSQRQGLFSPKRSPGQKYSFTEYTVFVSVRCNLYPWARKSPERLPEKNSTNSTEAGLPEYGFHQENYAVLTAFLHFSFIGTVYELNVAFWFCLIYFDVAGGFTAWKIFQYVLIGIRSFAALSYLVMLIVYPLLWITSLTVLFVGILSLTLASAANSLFLVIWADRRRDSF